MSKTSMYMSMAGALEKESKCISMGVGCVIVKDDNVISTGINGTPKGAANCCKVHKERGEEHSEWSELNEVHAEMNAILRCKVDAKGSIMYTTTIPCRNCLKHVNAFGIKIIIFRDDYYRMTDKQREDIIAYCVDNGILLSQLQENGLYSILALPEVAKDEEVCGL